MNNNLLEVKNLSLFLNKDKILLKNISFNLKKNQCLAIVGESGSGKSLTCKVIIGLLEPYFNVQGQILFNSTTKLNDHPLDLLKQSKKILQSIRGNLIAMVLQHPMSAFDPLYSIGKQIIETIKAHQVMNKKDAMSQILKMMNNMGFDKPEQILNKYPHQLSGGMLQRIMIALALLVKPDLIIADEPTTALDSITQFEMLKIFEQIKQQKQTAMIFISHDLGVVHQIADEIIVMNQGEIVEQGNRDEIFYHAQNPYTRYLITQRKQLLLQFNTILNNNDTPLISNKNNHPLITVNHVKKSFLQPNQKIFGHKKNLVINDVSFSLYPGECLGIVGESGSGKSTLAKLILGLEQPDSGTILFNNVDINKRDRKNKTFRQNMSTVFQDYNSSVNPYFSVAQIIAEPIDIDKTLSRLDKKKRIFQLLELVGLDSSFYSRYPHQMSGGQLQRICIARAIASNPQFILFDEAVSSLDISIQTQILSLLANLHKQLNLTSIFITHDLTTVTYLCDRVIFFYQGQIIEDVDSISQLSNVKHPYSKQLLHSVLGF